MKFLLWAVIIVLVVMWIMREKKTGGTVHDARQGTGAGAGKGREALPEPQPMIQCAECGLHLPASEALAGPRGTVFCSEEHRLRHAGR
jgi:uncharacterized protein